MRLDPAALRSLGLAILDSPARRSRWTLVALGALVFAIALALASPATVGPGEAPVVLSPTPAPALDGPAGERALPPYEAAGGSLALVAEPDWPALLLDLGGKLLLTLALAYASLYLLRRYVVRPAGQGRTARIAIVETVALGQHRSLHLVRVGGQHLLLGATPTQISLLAEVKDPESGWGAPSAAAPGGERSFEDHLRSLAESAARDSRALPDLPSPAR